MRFCGIAIVLKLLGIQAYAPGCPMSFSINKSSDSQQAVILFPGGTFGDVWRNFYVSYWGGFHNAQDSLHNKVCLAPKHH